MQASMNRREFERVSVQPMYTTVIVDRVREGRIEQISGHAYDLSEGGVRMELDERLEVGEHVNLSLQLPCIDAPIHVGGQVVWVNDEDDDPAMPRQAVRITTYLSDRARDRMVSFLGAHPAARAA